MELKKKGGHNGGFVVALKVAEHKCEGLNMVHESKELNRIVPVKF